MSERTVERLKIMLADALLEKAESDTMRSYWFDQCDAQSKRIEEMREKHADDFSDLVKEITDQAIEIKNLRATINLYEGGLNNQGN